MHYNTYVEEIERAIESDEKMSVIALYGQNGIGKTSVLNLLKERMAYNSSYKFVVFEPYKYKSDEEMALQFFRSITRGISKDIHLPYLSSIPEKYLRIMYGVSDIYKVNFLLDIFLPKLSTDDLKKHLCNYLKLFQIKIVMVIDDLDRCSVKKRYLLFQLINVIGKIDNIHYLIAASPNELLNYVEPSLVSLVE